MTFAVVTLLYDPSYLPGALVLGVSLRKLVASSPLDIELSVLIDESKFSKYQLDLLLELYDTLIPVQTLTSTLKDKLQHELGRPELAKTFTKVALWGLTRYSKVLYLDSDTLPETLGENTILDLFKLHFPSNKILAVPDSGFPDIFNSGVFVLQPNARDHDNLMGLVVDSELTGKSISFDGADQGLLNQYFNPQPNWVVDLLSKQKSSGDVQDVSDGTVDVATAETAKSSNWIKLPFLYNVTPSCQYEYLPAYKYFTEGDGVPPPPPSDSAAAGLSGRDGHQDEVLDSTQSALNNYNLTASTYFQGGNQIKLVHFIGPYKPWFTKKVHPVHEKWWNLWYDYYGKTSSIDVIAFWEKAIGKDKSAEEISSLYYQKGKEAGIRSGEGATNLEVLVGSSTTEQEHQHQHQHEHEYHAPPPAAPEPVPESSITDPNFLCDPRNYQLFESNIEPTVDSAWDATREEPPKAAESEQSHHHEQTYEMQENMRAFENVWDAPESHPEPEPEPIPEPQPEPQPEPAHEPQQHSKPLPQSAHEPERVFEPINYDREEPQEPPVHQHRTKKHTPKPKPSILKKPSPPPAVDPIFHREYVEPERVFHDTVEFPSLFEKLRDLQAEEDEDEEEEEQLDDEEDAELEKIAQEDAQDEAEEELAMEPTDDPSPVHNYNKIFPWEFRSAAAPERSFDDW